MKKTLSLWVFMVWSGNICADFANKDQVWFEQIAEAQSSQQLEARAQILAQMDVERLACSLEKQSGFIPKSCFVLEGLWVANFSTNQQKHFKTMQFLEELCLESLLRYNNLKLLKHHMRGLNPQTRCFEESQKRMQVLLYKQTPFKFDPI